MTTRLEDSTTHQNTNLQPRSSRGWPRALALLALLAGAALLLPGLASAVPPQPGECPVDFDSNGVINAADMAAITEAWSAKPGDVDWDARLDLNGDRVIGAVDRGMVASFWGPADCTIEDLKVATVWTGTAAYHATFCPLGEITLQVHDPDFTDGTLLYEIPIVPEECLRSPASGMAIYACVIDGDIVDSQMLQLIPDENVTSQGNHVCNPANPAN